MSDWDIKPLVRGEVYGYKSVLVWREDMGEEFWHPSMVYYLTNGELDVLIDTSFRDPEVADFDESMFTIRMEQSFEELLETEAVPVEEFDIVIQSHLHWDHAGNVDAFADTDAEILVQREERRYAAAPLEIYDVSFLSPSMGYSPSWKDAEFTFIDGDTTIAPGLRAIKTPGHTPGHMSFLVENGDTTYGLPIDVLPTYRNIEGVREGLDVHPPTHMDMEAWWESAHRLKREADVLIPSHDPEGPANEWVTR
jgi:glyoxylase-like metal-dependent hydrolase (beta-lactamase superfamily II)